MVCSICETLQQQINARKRFLKELSTSVLPNPRQILKLRSDIKKLEFEISICSNKMF
jgi:hypothetical protein